MPAILLLPSTERSFFKNINTLRTTVPGKFRSKHLLIFILAPHYRFQTSAAKSDSRRSSHPLALPSPGGIDHGLFGLLLGALGLVEHVVEVGVEGLHLALEFPLGDGGGRVVGLQLGQLVLAVRQVQLRLTDGQTDSLTDRQRTRLTHRRTDGLSHRPSADTADTQTDRRTHPPTVSRHG